MRTSGFVPEENICWQFNNPGDRSVFCQCPVCTTKDERALVFFGRCRSGLRWFWAATSHMWCSEVHKAHGFTETEVEAVDAAIAAVLSFRKAGQPMHAIMHHGYASRWLQQLNKEKRAARPPSDAKDLPVVEYLWSWGKRYQIIKRTKQRIYYNKNGEGIDDRGEPIDYHNVIDTTDRGIGFMTHEYLKNQKYRYYFATFEELLAERRKHIGDAPTDLATLKQMMAEAHPDRGGSSAAFIEARAQYVAARRAAR